MKQTITVRTKLNKDDKNPKTTVLTLDFTGCTVEMLAGPAADSLVINRQGAWRRSGKVPQTEVSMVKDLIARMGSRSGGPVTVDSVAAQFAALSPADRAKMLKKAEADAAKAEAETKGNGDKKPAEKKNKGFKAPTPTATESPKGGDGGSPAAQ